MRLLDFADGFESATEPTQGNLTSNSLKVFASDAAYVTDKGSAAAQGDIYLNSTTDKVRFYNDAGWVDVLLEDTSGNVTLDGNLTVSGDLTIQGTTTTVNTATLDVEDKNITINNGGDDSTSEGSGLTIDRTGTSGSFVYEDALASKFKLGAAGSEAQVVTVSHTQTLTNKTLTSPSLTTPSLDVMTLDGQASTPSSPSSGFYKAYVKDSTNKLTLLDSSGNETSIGAGGGAVNFVTNPDAEAGTTGYTIDSFAAASRPAGALTGTTTGITFSTSSSSPLAGVNSFTLAKDASNRQGRVVYTPITITPAYQTKVLNVSMDYIVSSGTFVAGSSGVDSDVIVYLQDVTNSTFIEPSSFKLLSNSTTIADKFQGTFQTSATGTSYRLLLYFPTTTTSAFTLKLDNISVSPSNYVYGTPITDWSTDWTPTGSWSTNTTYTGKWRRVGSNMEMVVKVTCSGAPTATTLYINLPGSYTIDTNITPVYTAVGQTYVEDYGIQAYMGPVFIDSSTRIYPLSHDTSATYSRPSLVTQTTPITFGASDFVILTVSVPILGWSSSVQMSDSADTRVVTARAYRSGNQSVATAAETDIVFNATSFDDVGGFDTSTGVYTVQVPGKYNVKTSLYISSAASEVFTIAIYKNSTQVAIRFFTATADAMVEVSDVLNCVAGDTIKSTIDSTADTSYTIIGSSVATFTTIERVTGPSAIAASESVNARYTSASTSINNSGTIVQFNTADYDSHSSVTTGASWKFTAPISGKYNVAALLAYTAQTIGVNGVQYMYLFKNGSSFGLLDWTIISSVTNQVVINRGSTTIRLLAGDYIDIRAWNNTTTSLSGNVDTHISIERVGNY